jgi:hypothetical protein
MCLYPRLIRNRKYTVTDKNGGNVPEVKDNRVLSVPIGCGKCGECRKQKANQWRVRLLEDIRVNKGGNFMTLTFSDKSLIELDEKITKTGVFGGQLKGYDRDNEICSIAVRRFTERWRKKYGKTIRHWLVTELGQEKTERVHMHGILWLDEKPKGYDGWKKKEQITYKIYDKEHEFGKNKVSWYEYNKEQIKDLDEKWGYGIVRIGDGKGKNYISEESIHYFIKYVHKTDKKHKEYTSKIYTSKGIGRNYTKRSDIKRNEYKKEGGTIETYKTRTGIELGLPIYYRNKIYTDDEKEELWLEKLDKKVRWVDGVRVDISEGEEEYYKLLEVKRARNKRLGYGDDAKNWELKKYENDRRNLKKIERYEKLYGKGQANKLRSRVSISKSL